MRRRSFPIIVAGVLCAALTACSSDGDGGDAGEPAEDAAKVEVFSWWEGPGEAEGYAALINRFKKDNPDIEFVNAAVAGGAGSNARTVLASRLAANDPPDAFQVHLGLEQEDDVKAGKVEDLTALFDQNGWRDKFSKPVLDAVTFGGKIYSVPVGIHRSNVLWFNAKTVQAAGITKPPATWSEFLKVAATLKSKNVVPLSIGPGWTQKHLLENVLLGELGAEKYSGLWKGKTSWLGPDVHAAVTMFTDVLAMSDIKTFGGDWQSALDKVIDGQAAYNVMGDWADAYLSRTRGLTFKTEYDATTSPGTDGVFNFLGDGFTVPKGAPHRAAADAWLKVCASKDGQEEFSVEKHSLPARIDAEETKFSGYPAIALEAWRNPDTVVVGSATHGTTVGSARGAEFDTALAKLVESGDVDAFQKALASTYAGYLASD
ncbi:extracellular solute-binding protein [Actinoplanes sp. NPDC026670]|uniref:ABC transporter substrate-binding protein n=1 Tax=Actinoplanes sp. NPDC026670 TaxID=3154700 RepID=UPI0033C63EDA